MTFEEKVLRDRALANGENPDDPEVNARIQQELQGQEAEEISNVCTPQEIHALYDELICIFTNMDAHINKPALQAGMSMPEIFHNEAIGFALDLIAVDGVIKQAEAEAFNTIFDMNFSVNDYVNFYNERDAKSFLQIELRAVFVPQSYYAAVVADKALFPGKDYFTVKVMKFFLEFIKTVTTIDGELSEDEADHINRFNLAISSIKEGDNGGYLYVV